MLRITIEEKGRFTRLRLEGKLIGDWVRELERCWIRAKTSDQDRRIKVNLSNVGFVDEKGKALLERLAAEGAKLEADNPLMKSLIAKAVEHSTLERASR